MSRYVENHQLPGALTLVSRQGEVVFLEVQGARDLQSGSPLRFDSIFRFYSMSKPITSVAVMMLHEQGKIDIDDPIEVAAQRLLCSSQYVENAEPGRRLAFFEREIATYLTHIVDLATEPGHRTGYEQPFAG